VLPIARQDVLAQLVVQGFVFVDASFAGGTAAGTLDDLQSTVTIFAQSELTDRIVMTITRPAGLSQSVRDDQSRLFQELLKTVLIGESPRRQIVDWTDGWDGSSATTAIFTVDNVQIEISEYPAQSELEMIVSRPPSTGD